jgi:hypothetical protein
VGVQVDDAALKADRNGVDPIVRPELGKNVRHVCLDRCFANRQLIGDVLVCVAGRDQSQNVYFSCR